MMNDIRRRDFLLASAATLAAGGMMNTQSTAEAAEAPKFKTTLHKAKIAAPSEATLKSWADAGFEGMETTSRTAWSKSPAEAAKDHLTAERLGMRIHSVLFGWANFNNPDSGKVAGDVENVKAALRAAQGYGADTVLLVPCRIGGMPMPAAWEFDIKFDEKTGHIHEVVAGDNSKYEKYIEAHNISTDAPTHAVNQLDPTDNTATQDAPRNTSGTKRAEHLLIWQRWIQSNPASRGLQPARTPAQNDVYSSRIAFQRCPISRTGDPIPRPPSIATDPSPSHHSALQFVLDDLNDLGALTDQ